MQQLSKGAEVAQRPARGRPDDGTGSLLGQLAALGLRPRLMRTGNGWSGSGAALRMSFHDLLASPELAAHLFGRLRRLLVHRIPVTVTVTDLGSARLAAVSFERFCDRLDDVLGSQCIDRRQLGIAVYAAELGLPAFLLISRVLLGHGPRYHLLDPAHLNAGRRDNSHPTADAIWSGLFLQRARASRVLPAYGGGVRTRCPLLGDEQTGALLPGRAVLVPPDTAWLPVDVCITDFADASGALRKDELRAALTQGLEIADYLFDTLQWPDGPEQQDAFVNRRIGMELHGIGELVARRGQDPGSLDCLRECDRLLADMHGWLWEQSRSIARTRGLLPALEQKDPSRTWSDQRHRSDWLERWRQALTSAAVRHRNLLVMSPYCVLPRNSARAQDYIDLLPLLAHADACSFGAAPAFTDWTITEYKRFHRRAFAVMKRRNAAAFVASDTAPHHP
ncbi:MAG: hypothetical protein WD078_00845 [Woeseia sp.]